MQIDKFTFDPENTDEIASLAKRICWSTHATGYKGHEYSKESYEEMYFHNQFLPSLPEAKRHNILKIYDQAYNQHREEIEGIIKQNISELSSQPLTEILPDPKCPSSRNGVFTSEQREKQIIQVLRQRLFWRSILVFFALLTVASIYYFLSSYIRHM